MPILRVTAAICAGFFLISTPVLAAGPKQTVYSCTLQVTRNQGWVPKQFFISISDTDSEVLVFDPIIRYFMGKPIRAKRVVDTPERLTLKWNLKRILKVEPSDLPLITYTAKLTKKDKRIVIEANPVGVELSFIASGVCKLEH